MNHYCCVILFGVAQWLLTRLCGFPGGSAGLCPFLTLFQCHYSSTSASPGQSSMSQVCPVPPGSTQSSCHCCPLLCPAVPSTPSPGCSKATSATLWGAKPHWEPTRVSGGLPKILAMNKMNKINKIPNQHRAVTALHPPHTILLLTYKSLQPHQCWNPSSKPIKMGVKPAFKKLPGQGQLLN